MIASSSNTPMTVRDTVDIATIIPTDVSPGRSILEPVSISGSQEHVGHSEGGCGLGVLLGCMLVLRLEIDVVTDRDGITELAVEDCAIVDIVLKELAIEVDGIMLVTTVVGETEGQS